MRTTLGPHTHKGTRSTFGKVKGITYLPNDVTPPKEATDQKITLLSEENTQAQWAAPV